MNPQIKRQAKAFNDLGVIPKDVSGDIEKYWDTAILAAAMMLRYSLNLADQADRIENAVRRVLAQGYRTGDIYEEGTRKVGTEEMGAAVLAAL